MYFWLFLVCKFFYFNWNMHIMFSLRRIISSCKHMCKFRILLSYRLYRYLIHKL